MKRNPLSSIILALCLSLPALPAAAAPRELPLRFVHQARQEPLTTDMLAEVDPEQVNPHRQRWAMRKDAELDGLQAVAQPNGRFGVKADALLAVVKSYVRPDGPWYRPLQEFPCRKDPVSWFATREGARKAANEAARLWEEELAAKRFELTLLLHRISATTPEIAVIAARYVFQNWLRGVNKTWNRRDRRLANGVEWEFYRSQAKQLLPHGCDPKTAEAPQPLFWESMMEPVTPHTNEHLLARAPARRWKGMFSVRLNFKMGNRALNGQFLIDSAAPVSVISPTWLENQGVVPAFVEDPGAPMERVTWGGHWKGEGALARRVEADSVEMSGTLLPIREFLLHETEFFGPPESALSCCDGVLGSDFLRRFVVEFRPGSPNEVLLWAIGAFRPDAEKKYEWVEVALSTEGQPASACTLNRDPASEIFGVFWNTAETDVAEVHVPWRSKAAGRGTWQLKCRGQLLASDLLPDSSQKPRETSTVRTAVPGADIGVPLLARGNFIIDLPHGRLWFSKESLSAKVPRNESGLELSYDFHDGERVLKVQSVAQKSPAAVLLKAGLKPGMVITQLDSKNADDMDEWEVDQRLSGVYGPTVNLAWETKRGIKIAPLATGRHAP